MKQGQDIEWPIFTHEDLSDSSQCTNPINIPLAPDIRSHLDSIQPSVIKSLNINNASGSDNISAITLVICAEEIASFYVNCLIYLIVCNW